MPIFNRSDHRFHRPHTLEIVSRILLSLAGLALAYKPLATILQIATQTFTGLAVLFPTVIFGLYFKRVFALAAILSIGHGFLGLGPGGAGLFQSSALGWIFCRPVCIADHRDGVFNSDLKPYTIAAVHT